MSLWGLHRPSDLCSEEEEDEMRRELAMEDDDHLYWIMNDPAIDRIEAIIDAAERKGRMEEELL